MQYPCQLVLKGRNTVAKKEKLFLVKEYFLDLYFYTLPKIYKDSKNPLGRPIIAGMEGLSSGPSDYIDLFPTTFGKIFT